MIKKMMPLVIAVGSAAAFMFPAGASAQEAHWDVVTAFTGTFGLTNITSEAEPVITCEGPNHEEGVMSAGGTTGDIQLDMTKCHTTVFGITTKCRTAGSPLDDTIAIGGAFHAITVGSGNPALLMTLAERNVVCAGISSMNVSGSLIGTITSPACGASSKTMTLKFSATGSTQEHKTYTGTTYNLTSQTSGGSVKTAGLNAQMTSESATTGTLTCT